VGIFRAWNVRVDEGVEMADLEAEVRVFHIGEWLGVVDEGSDEESSLSFVAAIVVKRDARRRKRSAEGYE